MAELRNIIFDVGDVLIGYRWRQMLMDYGLTESEADRVGREMFDDPRRLWHQFDLGTYSVNEICGEYAKEWPEDAGIIEWFIRHGEYMSVPRPKVWDRVHALKGKGYHIYLLSNYPEELFHKHMQYCDVMNDLDGMVISYMYHETKPDRAIYERLCRTYGLNPAESLFFDDRDENIEGALDYGIGARKVRSQQSLAEDLDCLLEGKPFRTRGMNGKIHENQTGTTDENEIGSFGVGDSEEKDNDPGFGRESMKIAVYCGANFGSKPEYAEAARKLGKWIGTHQDTLVYGAGALGMMGAVADETQKNGGKIIGVIPRFMVDNGWQRDGLDQMIVTDTMSTRKMKMAELADVCVAMPGGPGTVDEIAEMISLSALHLHDKECILCSVDGYYEPLRQMYERMVLEGFSPEEKLEHTHFAGSIDELLDLLEGIARAR